MKVAVIRHGIGREANRIIPFLENGLYKELKESIDNDFDFYYLYRKVDKLNSTRTKEHGIVKTPDSLDFETRIEVKLPEKDIYIDFSSIVKFDIYKDNYNSFKNLFNQNYMFKEFIKIVNIKKYDSVIILRDDILITKYPNINKLLSYSKKFYVTSYLDWEGGVFERFFICPTNLFIDLSNKSEALVKKSMALGEKLHPFYLSGEWLSYATVKKSNLKIWPCNIKTIRVRLGPKLYNERHRIRFHDLRELKNLIYNYIYSRLLRYFYLIILRKEI